jgi:valyl-tRNA synthetase
MNPLMELVTQIRTVRATYEVDPKRRIDAAIVDPSADASLKENQAWIRALGRIDLLEILDRAREAPQTIVQPMGDLEIHIPMAGLFDIASEKTRLGKERLKIEAELDGLRRRLENPQFLERAKAEVVAESRDRVSALTARLARVRSSLDALGT